MASRGEVENAAGNLTAEGESTFERACFVALLEAQPVPTVLFGPGGDRIHPNAAARRLMTIAPGGAERILAQDGTDLWTIIEARSDEASPFFDVRVRVRLTEGQTSDATVSVFPIRGAGGLLAGAIVFFLNLPTERRRGPQVDAIPVSSDDFPSLVASTGQLTGAACAYVLEVDLDIASEAHVLAYWTADGSTMPTAAFNLQGTPSDSFAGRSVVCVPSGVAEAYADDPTLSEGGFDAYVGVALPSAQGTHIGVLAGLWREPLTDIPGTCAVFTIAAKQAAHALNDLLAQRELRESEQRYGSVFEGSAVPILLIEPHTTQIVDVNPAACAMYGYQREEFISMSILQIDALPSDTVQGELQRALEGSRSNFIGKHMLSGGMVRDVEVNIGPIMVAGRQLLYAMVNDITRRTQMEAELERSKKSLEGLVAQRTEDLLRANAELQQASTARDMVFASLAQELRTSLQTITGFSGLLLGGKTGELGEEQRRQVEMIQEAGKRLATFATTLMETPRIDASPISRDEFDIVSLVESMLFGLASFAEDKGLSLTIFAEERPIEVEADRYKLQQILLNLLSNAIRYTEKGGVTVTVTREAEGACTVAVADTGPGLSPERAESIFNGPETHDSSAGIGLPTSRRIAAILGGTIDVESTPGHGSVFSLRIPRVPPEPEPGE